LPAEVQTLPTLNPLPGALRPLTQALQRIAAPKWVGLFWLLALLSCLLINGQPFGVAQLQTLTGGVGIPDMEFFGYSPERAYAILTAQGEAGRAFYLQAIIPQDFPFPFFYALAYATALTALARRLLPADHPGQALGLLGLLAGAMDWAENICLLTLLLNYPHRLDSLAGLASIFTILKTLVFLVSTSLLAAGLAWGLGKALGHKASPAR
jgi:hypothetical protein